MTRTDFIQAFMEARTAFLADHRDDVLAYVESVRANAVIAQLSDIDETKLTPRELENYAKFVGDCAVSHIKIADLSPSFFLEAAFFEQAALDATTQAVVDAARALTVNA